MLLEGNEIIKKHNIEVILCYWKVMRLLKTQYRGNIMLLEGNEIIKNTI